MSNSSVAVPPDSTGKKIRTTQTSVSGVVVEEQVIQLANAQDSIISPASEEAIRDKLAHYKFADTLPDSSGNDYFGFVDKSENWYILRLNDTSGRYAAGTGEYETAWAGRENLTYDYLFNVVIP